MDFTLTGEQTAVVDAVKQVVKKHEPRRAQLLKQIFNDKHYPEELWTDLADAGFVGSVLPEEYGGTGLGLLPFALGMEELGSAGYASALHVVTVMDALCILRNADEALKRKVLPGVAEGKTKLCFALTEPDAGSNTFRLRTFARRDGDTYRVTGQKTFITGADSADLMLLPCRSMTPEDVTARGLPKVFGFSVLLVDPKSKGIELRPIPTRGIEGHSQFTVFLDDVVVPASQRVGKEHEGAEALFNSLNPERILAAAIACGMTRYLLDRACDYARKRNVFGKGPIGAYQAIQHPLADARIRLDGARLLTYRAAWAFDQGKDPAEVGAYANMAKYTAADLAIDAADRAIETLGGYGFSEEYGIVHLWEAARLLRTAPVTKEMILNFVGEHVLSLPRSY
ncbi:MAG: acyl-CoA/acyl-ACP dehydrogenase [Planctomycetes bacterium]|nr:acyl-CoA/acyl-ACP dehydrogenase [Planctomycetota bacterium]